MQIYNQSNITSDGVRHYSVPAHAHVTLQNIAQSCLKVQKFVLCVWIADAEHGSEPPKQRGCVKYRMWVT